MKFRAKFEVLLQNNFGQSLPLTENHLKSDFSTVNWIAEGDEIRYASINSSGAHPPRATVGHLLTLSVPGVGIRNFIAAPGAEH